MTYTPGPWRAFQDAAMRHTVGTADVRICDMWGQDPAFYTEEDEANARLIAAAPHLLVALRRLMDWEGFCAPGGHQAVDEAAQTAREIWSDALAAIASATGQADQATHPIEDMYTDEEDAR